MSGPSTRPQGLGIRHSQAAVDATGASALGSAATGRWLDMLAPLQRPLRWRWTPLRTLALGTTAAAVVGYVTSTDPRAAPAHVAVALRVSIILALTLASAYAQTSTVQTRMGRSLAAAAGFSVLWLLNGAGDRVLFSVGVLFTGVAFVVFAYVMLAHPSGGLRTRAERRLVLWGGGGAALAWVAGLQTTNQPPLRTPLLSCMPHCPAVLFSVAGRIGGSAPLRAIMVLLWSAVTYGTVVLLYRRLRGASPPLRRALWPVCAVAVAAMLLLTALLLSRAAGSNASAALGAAYTSAVLAVPVAVIAGLALERLYLGRALAGLVQHLANQPHADPEALIGSAVSDPSLRIAYRRRGPLSYVDSSGRSIDPPEQASDRAISWIECNGRPVAAVVYDAELADQEPFIQAAGAAALMRLEQAQLTAELAASTKELEDSRSRLVEAAHAERRRLERDLHDGVQQQVVGLRIKLEVAAEAMRSGPVEGERLLGAIGHQMDELLETLRTLARGIYPALLERGVGEALKAAARSSPVPVSVRPLRISRYPDDVEVAVYFCCLEALQNVAKHAGPKARATLTLWESGSRLCFRVRDSGVGFDSSESARGSGVTNMHDRIHAVGGTVAVESSTGRGTSVHGCVPIA